MSQPQRDERVDHDPLLEYSIEPDAASIAPTQPNQPVAASGVSAAERSPASSPDHDAALRARIERLEKTLDRSIQDIDALRSEVATLVGVTRDIKSTRAAAVNTAPLAAVVKAPIKIKRSPRQRGRVVGAVAGIVLGVAAGMWIWTAMSTEPLIPAAPISAAPQAITVSPEPPAAIATPAIVPVAAVTPVHTAPPHEPSRPIEYVGTLSIDSDPPGEVFIDRKSAGRTPLLAPNLRAGSHLIWIERDGYRRFTRVVQVPADRVSRVVADLESAAQR